ncbi:MAG: SGNH/GDSL hydrolase family protein [Pseudomonadota bacterium]
MTEKRIMCFGDSLTWGWVPVSEGVPTTRYPAHVRWTGVLQSELGSEYSVIEEGLSARTTALSDPTDPRLDGSAYLPSALASHLPLDLVVLMLGTNDTKAYFHRTPFEITAGLSKLVGQVLSSGGGIGTAYPAPRVLIVAPPPLTPMPHAYFRSLFEGGHEKSAEFGRLYGDLADFMKVHFFDAGTVISTDGVDGIHFTEDNNRTLGAAIAAKVTSIFDAEPGTEAA